VSKSLYITNLEGQSGKMVVVFALMKHLSGRLGSVSLFRPIVSESAGKRIIGVGLYIAYEGPDPPSAAEIAFVAEEDYHCQRAAPFLLKHLLLIGREQSISRFEAEVLPKNRTMLRVFGRALLSVAMRASGDSVHATIFLNKGGTP
jgi:hypothetical protein